MSAQTPDAAEVLVDRADGILTITINRPQARNAINLAVARGIAAAVDELDASDDLRIGILTGAGGSFCAGMDLKGFLRGERPSIEGARLWRTDRPAAAQAADRGGGGLCAGRRLRTGAGLRPGGGGRQCAVRRARGQARAGGHGRRPGAPAAPAALPHRAGAGADRRHVPGPARPRLWPDQPADRTRPGAGGRARTGAAHRRQRTAGRGRQQAGGGRVAGLAGRRGVGAPGGADRPCVRVGRRARGLGGLRGEAPARVAGK